MSDRIREKLNILADAAKYDVSCSSSSSSRKNTTKGLGDRSFFKNQYADQIWIIYDLKRRYELYYDLEKVEEIRLDVGPELKTNTTFLVSESVHNKEELYSLLWADYFRSTNIPARKNMKLHIQHVPKRYWKYLTEKQGKN